MTSLRQSSCSTHLRLLLAAFLALICTGLSAAEPRKGSSTFPLSEKPYPIDVSVSFSAALFHWLDSLSGLQDPGMSAGKTIAAHRETYDRLFGRPGPSEQRVLKRFGEIRRGFLAKHLDPAALTADPEGGPNALLVAFLEEPDLDSALQRAEGLLDERDHRELKGILELYAPRYEKIWNEGRIPNRFVEDARRSRRLDDLVSLLARIARFLGVDPTEGSRPHLILTPVQSGYGTHAQANGRHLLIELRSEDRLSSAASVIVHENVHLLMGRIGEERMRRLEAVVRELNAEEAARHLREAIPTALGQGIADREFRKGWSIDGRWYHTESVDSYAKRIYPVLEEALRGKGSFDETLVRTLLGLYPGG